MASAIPVTFPNITAIETMMAGLGDAQCKSIPIGRQDNYNHVIHRPREAYQDNSTKAIVGIVCQHRTFSVNKPNGRIIWIFERDNDNMMFLIKPRKGPNAYDVWLSNQTWSAADAWLHAHTFEKAESAAAKEKDPGVLKKWQEINRPQDVGNSGEYLKHKAHVARLAASLPLDNNETGLPTASSSTKDKDTGTGEDFEESGTSLPTVPQASTSKPASKTKPTKKAATSAAKKKPAKRTKKVAAPAPSSRQLRSKTTTQKRKAVDAELDDDETEDDQQALTAADKQSAPQELAPKLVRPAKIAASSKPIAKPKSKKSKLAPSMLGPSEQEYEKHGKELLFGWFPSVQQDNSDAMDLDGVDFIPQMRLSGYNIFNRHDKKTLIRYGATGKDIFGGDYGLEGKALTIEVPGPKPKKGLTSS